MQLEPVLLVGKIVDLEPLTIAHLSDLVDAAAYDGVWTYLDEPTPESEQPVAALIDEAISEQANGERLPFAIIERQTGRAVGSISYIDIQSAHHGVEIGWAWLTPSKWRTGASREAAYLLMRHAFETLGAIRVAFKADSRNVQSQQAIAGLGAVREGTFRNHRILRDGHVRHSVYYSVTHEDWPTVRRNLEAEQARHRSAGT